jgi:osmotically inducible lipoprotein OsmB
MSWMWLSAQTPSWSIATNSIKDMPRARTSGSGLCNLTPQESFMTIQNLRTLSLMALVALLGACSSMSPRDRNTTTGAVIGGAAGAILSGGSAAGTVGGAAVGGIIGNQIDPHKK